MATRRTVMASIAGLALVGPMIALGQEAETGPQVYRLIGRGPARLLQRRGGTIRLVLGPGFPEATQVRLLHWIDLAATAIETYYDAFPVREYGLLILPEPGDGVGHATTWGFDGPVTRFHVGRDVTDDAIRRDWKLTHEMVHVAFPNLPRRALWLQEGNATFIEPLARAQAVQLDPAKVWGDLLIGIPAGLPRAGESGMDGTERWGRLYWGGALFWLEAAIAIDAESQGRRSLRDALRAILKASGGIGTGWSPEQTMAAGDRATGTAVLATLYRRFADGSMTADVPALLAKLGVMRAGDGFALNDGAPLARLRRRLTDAALG